MLDVFVETLALMRDRIAEPWGVYVWFDEHLEATERLGMVDKRVYFPYGLIESEPSFPLIEYSPTTIAQGIARSPPSARPRGLMGNAQTHCLQLPHLYLFAHYARGGTEDISRCVEFGDNLLPGRRPCSPRRGRLSPATTTGPTIAGRKVRRQMGASHRLGPCSGLLFGDADRFLE